MLAVFTFLPSFNAAATRLPDKEQQLSQMAYKQVSHFSAGAGFHAALQDGTPSPTVPIVIPGLQTAVPVADGSVTHIVREGQSLWGIAMAYGVTIAEIRALNGMTFDNTVIVAGQELVIYPANPDTAFTPTIDQQVAIDQTATDAVENAVIPTTVTPIPTFTASPPAFTIPVSAEERLSKPGSMVFPLVGVLLIVAGFVLRQMVKRQR